MFGLASRYGSYEVTYKALNYPPHTFDDPKIEKQKMVVDAEDRSDAEDIVKKTLKKQGLTFNHIYDVRLIKYKSKSTNETNISSSKSSSEPAPYNPAVVKFLLILIAIVGGLGLLIFIGHSILSAIFL